jgi:hypothetical protein
LLALESTVSLGSFSGGFSSTAGYVPGNEALVETRAAWHHLADQVQLALSVFIRITRSFRRNLQQAFRLRIRAMIATTFPPFAASGKASPLFPLFSIAVKMPVSNFDCEAILHPIFLMSRRKYFKYLGHNLTEAVENFGLSVVDILWKSAGAVVCITVCK